MAQLSDRTEHDVRIADTTELTDEYTSLVTWQNTTMLDPETFDGVPEDHILRGID